MLSGYASERGGETISTMRPRGELRPGKCSDQTSTREREDAKALLGKVLQALGKGRNMNHVT
jgi:hypothetical protein